MPVAETAVAFVGQHVIHDREIVDCQVPDHIYVVLKETQIHAHRIVIVDVTQSIGGDQLANLSYRARVNEGVVHHEDLLPPSGFLDQGGLPARSSPPEAFLPARVCRP